MKKTLLIGTMAFLSTMLLLDDAYARGRGRGRGGQGMGCGGKACVGCGMGQGSGRAMALNQLNLSDAQWTQVEKLRTAHQAEMIAIQDALDVKREQMRKLWLADRPDRVAIANLHAEMDPLRSQMRDARTEHRLAVLEVLTPDQRAQLKTIRGQGRGFGNKGAFRGRGGRGYGRGYGRGQGGGGGW